MLLAGDDTGSIWLYNLQGFAPWGGTAVPDPDSLYQPSRIIEWPEIHIKSNDMGDLKDPTVRRMESESSAAGVAYLVFLTSRWQGRVARMNL